MGSTRAWEAATIMTDMVGLDHALRYHLQTNHFPPVPEVMIEVAKQAIVVGIQSVSDEDPEVLRQMIELPDGVTTGQGETSVSASKVIESFHLDAFIDVGV